MEDVVKVAREISGKERIPLYLSEDEIRRLDREEAVEEGYNNAQREMIINMYKDNLSLEVISKYANISVEDIKKIVNETEK